MFAKIKFKLKMKNYKIEIKWALLFSMMTLIWMYLESALGYHDKNIASHPIFTSFYTIPAIVFIVLALKDKKKNFFNNQISYKQGLISGLFLSIFIAFLAPLTQWITSNFISPNFFTNAINYSFETGHFKNLQDAEAYFNFKSYVVKSVIGALFIGIITSSIAMIFIRSKNK